MYRLIKRPQKIMVLGYGDALEVLRIVFYIDFSLFMSFTFFLHFVFNVFKIIPITKKYTN